MLSFPCSFYRETTSPPLLDFKSAFFFFFLFSLKLGITKRQHEGFINVIPLHSTSVISILSEPLSRCLILVKLDSWHLPLKHSFTLTISYLEFYSRFRRRTNGLKGIQQKRPYMLMTNPMYQDKIQFI